MNSVLMPSEIEFYIDTMVPQKMQHLGNTQWLEWHQRLQKLNQEAIVEASQVKDEHVKEALVTFDKVPVLVHEVILVNIWKHKVLPQLLKLQPNPASTFMAYSILYHEAVAVGLLELVMYHENCCEALGDAAADLLDYACGTASQLLSIEPMEPARKESGKQELARQLNNLSFDIGMRSLAIVRYICEHMNKLSVGILSRIYTINDVPMLFIQLLEARPWIKDGSKQYRAGKWVDWDGEFVGQAEGQVWLTLRHLLLDPECQTHYSVTDARRSQIIKLMMLLTPVVLDQLSPLIELKQWLSHVSIAEQPSSAPKPILIEALLEIKDRILAAAKGNWKNLARDQLPVIFCSDQKTLMETAQKLSDAYNTDFLEKLDVKEKETCIKCNKSAIQRCSRCKKTWYCSRSCQVAHWPDHKNECSSDSK